MRRRAWFSLVAVLCVVSLLWAQQRQAEAFVPPGGTLLSFLYEAASLSGGTASVPVRIGVGAASRWCMATASTVALGRIAGYVVIGGLAGYSVYKGWKVAKDWWNGKPVVGDPKGKVIIPGELVSGGDDNKLYVRWEGPGMMPPIGDFNRSWADGFTDMGLSVFDTAAGASYYQTHIPCPGYIPFTEGNGCGGGFVRYDYGTWSGVQVDSTDKWHVQGIRVFGHVWWYAWPKSDPPTTVNYAPATKEEIGNALGNGVGTSTSGPGFEQLRDAMLELQKAVNDNSHVLRTNNITWSEIDQKLKELVSQADWDAVSGANSSIGTTGITSGPGSLSQVWVDGLSSLTQEQLYSVQKNALATYGASRLTAAEVEQAHKNALAQDRDLRGSGAGVTQAQVQTAVTEALSANRAAEKADADGASLGPPPEFDATLPPVERTPLGPVLTAMKNALLSLPFVGFVSGMGLEASGGNPVISCVMMGKTVSVDFSKWQSTWSVCGDVLLLIVQVMAGRKLIGGGERAS